MKPSLLRWVESTEDQGEDTTTEMRRLGVEHANRLLEEYEFLMRALEINRLGRERFASYMPPTHRPAPPPQQSQHTAAVAQGPRPALTMKKAENA